MIQIIWQWLGFGFLNRFCGRSKKSYKWWESDGM